MRNALIPPSGREPLKARNPQQLELLKALCESEQVFAVGRAGTGKTYLVAATAANWLMQEKVDRFIISRPAVPCGEKHGFLPGRLEQKVAPWMYPIVDVLEERLGKENTRRMLMNEDIKVEDFEHMRGRTFKNAFVLLDEAQNTTVEQMKMFLTRVGEGCKLVVTGDPAQSDLGGHNGLSFALNVAVAKKLPVTICHLVSVERSGICGKWADAFEDLPPELPPMTSGT